MVLMVPVNNMHRDSTTTYALILDFDYVWMTASVQSYRTPIRQQAITTRLSRSAITAWIWTHAVDHMQDKELVVLHSLHSVHTSAKLHTVDSIGLVSTIDMIV